jgi:hypothetical protein
MGPGSVRLVAAAAAAEYALRDDNRVACLYLVVK